MPTAITHVRLPSQMILGCVKLTVKANKGTQIGLFRLFRGNPWPLPFKYHHVQLSLEPLISVSMKGTFPFAFVLFVWYMWCVCVLCVCDALCVWCVCYVCNMYLWCVLCL